MAALRWRAVWLAFMMMGVAAAGCVGVGPGDEVAEPGDDLVTLQGVVRASGGQALAEALVVVSREGMPDRTATTDADGVFHLELSPRPVCVVAVAKEGFAPASSVVPCRSDRTLAVTMDSVAADLGAPGRATGPEYARTGAGSVLVRGEVVAEGGTSPAGTELVFRRDGLVVAGAVLGPDGAFEVRLAPGAYVLTASQLCHARAAAPLRVAEPLRIDIVLEAAEGTTPAAPGGLRTTAGPGAGQVTLQWNAGPVEEDPVTHHLVWRRTGGSDPVLVGRLGTGTAWADGGLDPGTTYAYQVQAASASGCGPRSATVSGSPLFPPLPASVELRTLGSAASQDLEYAVHDAEGAWLRNATWRAVRGTGNCCENYVVTTPGGRIVDFGGTYLHFSDDLGKTWTTVGTPVPYLTGEGAAVMAPGGDILGIGWSPYSGDQLWSHKYSAAEDRWHYRAIPLHAPFHDRPWVAVVKGPFTTPEGLVAPYIALAMSNYGPNRASYLLSYDGIDYVRPQSDELEALLLQGGRVVGFDVGVDPDRDWIQTIQRALVIPVDHGVGLQRATSGLPCPWTVTGPDARWVCADHGGVLGGGHYIVDADGRLHHFQWASGTLTYGISVDAGASWEAAEAALPDGWRVQQWDARVHTGFGQAAVAIHAAKDDGDSQTLLWRFDVGSGTPRLVEAHHVGMGDWPWGAGLGASGSRFDFMTVAFLPGAKVVLSFGDAQHRQPALAIEL